MATVRRDWQQLDPLTYYREHYPGLTRTALFLKDASLYQTMRNRQLLQHVPTKKTEDKPSFPKQELPDQSLATQKAVGKDCIKVLDRLYRRCLRDPSKAPQFLHALEVADAHESLALHLWECWFVDWDNPRSTGLLRSLFLQIRKLTTTRTEPMPNSWESLVWILSAVTEREQERLWEWASQHHLTDLCGDIENCTDEMLQQWLSANPTPKNVDDT